MNDFDGRLPCSYFILLALYAVVIVPRALLHPKASSMLTSSWRPKSPSRGSGTSGFRGKGMWEWMSGVLALIVTISRRLNMPLRDERLKRRTLNSREGNPSLGIFMLASSVGYRMVFVRCLQSVAFWLTSCAVRELLSTRQCYPHL